MIGVGVMVGVAVGAGVYGAGVEVGRAVAANVTAGRAVPVGEGVGVVPRDDLSAASKHEQAGQSYDKA